MTAPSGPDDGDLPEPANLRFLRLLVTVLTAVMIGGIVAVVVLLFLRVPDPAPVLPDRVTLPKGAEAEAVTMGRGWIAIVTDDDRILIYDAASGKLRQTVSIEQHD